MSHPVKTENKPSRCVICARSIVETDGGLCDPHKYDEQTVNDDARIAAAVLADIQARYVLVPRQGAAQHVEHEIRDDGGVLWHAVAMDANLDPRVTFHHRYRTVTFGPWMREPQ